MKHKTIYYIYRYEVDIVYHKTMKIYSSSSGCSTVNIVDRRVGSYGVSFRIRNRLETESFKKILFNYLERENESKYGEISHIVLVKVKFIRRDTQDDEERFSPYLPKEKKKVFFKPFKSRDVPY